ncbi:MAG: nicotinamide mononucleotide transporter [Candidatus Paceibacterota bacterium]
MTTFDLITWGLNLGALIGVILNIKHRRECFYFWFVTNAGWCIVDYYKGIYAQAALFFVYWLLAIWGIFAWRSKS